MGKEKETYTPSLSSPGAFLAVVQRWERKLREEMTFKLSIITLHTT